MASSPGETDSPSLSDALDPLVDALVASYLADERTQHLDTAFLPNRARTIEVLEMLRRLIFPGFYDEQRLSRGNVRFHAGELLVRVQQALYHQVHQALCHEENRRQGNRAGNGPTRCDQKAQEITLAFLRQLPRIRELLATDLQAAFEGDPAARSIDETIFCYPGVDAIFTHRVAHALYLLDVPMIPRMMSEATHSDTGIDIHPGASIGESFFIDHGTGVVIGETCQIGKRVKIYQGVTLGALSTKGGQSWRGRKRHPTIEDDVTIYGGAIILGGDTVIGQGATIGGSVFLTQSVPPYHTVSMKSPELRMSPRRQRPIADAQELPDWSGWSI